MAGKSCFYISDNPKSKQEKVRFVVINVKNTSVKEISLIYSVQAEMHDKAVWFSGSAVLRKRITSFRIWV